MLSSQIFVQSCLEICAARNNNAELTLETKANQKGFYDAIKRALPAVVADRIEWKSNIAGGDVKVRDIIALSSIPLSLLPALPVKAPPPQNIYRNKGECAKLFDDLMSDPSVSTRAADGPFTRSPTTLCVAQSKFWAISQAFTTRSMPTSQSLQ